MIIAVCLNPVIQRTMVFASVVPGQVNRALQSVVCASGKGINVSRVLCQLGMPVHHITQAGGRHCQWFLSMVAEDKIPVTVADTSADIRFCTTLIAADTGAVTEIVEDGNTVEPPVSAAIERAVCEAVDRAVAGTPPEQSPVLVISGSKAPGFRDDIFPVLTEYALRRGVAVVCDYRGDDLVATLERCRDCAQDLLYIKPNEEEFVQTFADSGTSGIKNALGGICSRYCCSAVITCGAGDVLTYHNGQLHTVPVNAAGAVLNTTGCGDAFAAGFAAALAEHCPFDSAVARGIECGRRNAATLLPGSLV